MRIFLKGSNHDDYDTSRTFQRSDLLLISSYLNWSSIKVTINFHKKIYRSDREFWSFVEYELISRQAHASSLH